MALGEGLLLFKDLTALLRLELVDAQTYKTGAALHVCRPKTAVLNFNMSTRPTEAAAASHHRTASQPQSHVPRNARIPSAIAFAS